MFQHFQRQKQQKVTVQLIIVRLYFPNLCWGLSIMLSLLVFTTYDFIPIAQCPKYFTNSPQITSRKQFYLKIYEYVKRDKLLFLTHFS